MRRMRYETRQRLRTAGIYAALVLVTALMCFPLIWALVTSVKPTEEMLRVPPTLVPSRLTGDHYLALLTGRAMYFEGGAGYRPTNKAAPPHPHSLPAPRGKLHSPASNGKGDIK